MKKKSLSRQAKAKLETAIRHRINAGRVAIKGQITFFRRHFGQVSSDWKADASRVTFADMAISENLFASLSKDFAGDHFCSEEMSSKDQPIELKGDFVWVIDPIDGTNNFALGFPLCGISLALLFEGVPVYGFVYDFSVNSLYEGGEGFGLLKDQQKYTSLGGDREAQKIIGVQFPIEPSLFQKLTPVFSDFKIRALGSSTLLGCLAAQAYLAGVFDVRAKVWDIAATYALAEAVGNEFHFLNESPFPLKEFHTSLPQCPYFTGSKEFCAKIQSLLA
jgi:myo-inositol-1(or 4)-monophosphatase